MANTIYVRLKVEDKGWRFTKVPDGAGKPPQWLQEAKKAALNGGRGFQHRLADGGWSQQYKSIAEAIAASENRPVIAAAEARGLTVAESIENPDRQTLREAIDEYLDHKRINDSSRHKYTYQLDEFFKQLPRTIRYVDQAKEAMKTYLRFLEAKNSAPKTIIDKIGTVCFMLKAAGVDKPSKLIELPVVEDEEANPYSDEDLRPLFAAMTDEERLVYEFFLMTACREKEVSHAQWGDIDWRTGEYIVRSKTWKAPNGLQKSFTAKSHQSRRTPLTRELIDALLKMNPKKASTVDGIAWIFPNTEGQPDGHFLRKFKKIAYRAGLNCGSCIADDGTTCADTAEGCEKHYLHRLRSTRITFWLHQNVDVKTVMKWAGHKKMETTQIYAGVRETAKLQAEINARMF
jgi:integrase